MAVVCPYGLRVQAVGLRAQDEAIVMLWSWAHVGSCETICLAHAWHQCKNYSQRRDVPAWALRSSFVPASDGDLIDTWGGRLFTAFVKRKHHDEERRKTQTKEIAELPLRTPSSDRDD